ncbi:MAG: methylcrotonoyl-CoA carboxylase, partial [Pseudomonadota bacterium]
MSVLPSQIVADETYRENRAAMEAALAEAEAAIAAARDGGGAKARERHLARGKLLPRDRVER